MTIPTQPDASGSPPSLVTIEVSDSRGVAPGSSVSLRCPVDGADFFRWFKVSDQRIMTIVEECELKDERELTEPLESHYKLGKGRRKLTLVNFSAATQVKKCYLCQLPKNQF